MESSFGVPFLSITCNSSPSPATHDVYYFMSSFREVELETLKYYASLSWKVHIGALKVLGLCLTSHAVRGKILSNCCKYE
ncbi:hypothetical protein HanHA300_Chr06g0200391 [Helianthus annuus]|nr:hypothetical protein HanHA300_Chr06g0200341 [Helianthus annuus]KAJ0559442.1 hypothetical protein HanHA300_Chr06g0200391 [Helianthus annuus]KAJ0572412.1 hypothetical protein HanHA89_Chr06g0215431 [Helianthus annuus]KAJ0572417.1 hypothetical protein HanHA89_Chr06g0215481 [Helianthus annuus]